MHIDPYILTFSAVTVVATVFMGFWSAQRSKTASDFFVAGRSVSVGWNASAISGEYLSAASFMGVAGMVMSSGYDALWYPVCYACGYLFLLLFIAGPLRRFGAYTIPDFAEGRFDSPVFRKIAVVFVLFIGFFYTMPQMKGAGTTLAYIFPGLPYWVGVLLVGAVITLNVALGGMKGITLVQAFQYWAKMFAISVPIFVLMAVYGHYGKQVGINHAPQSAAPATPGFLFHTLESELAPSPPMTLALLLKTIRYKANAVIRPASMAKLPTGIQFSGTDSIQVLEFYAELTGRSVLKANVEYGNPKFFYTNRVAMSYKQAGQEVEAMLAVKGWCFLHLDDRVTIVAPRDRTNEILRYVNTVGLSPALRAPLPAKAPNDETWLNPFGPLTTKAAKAAKPKIEFTGPVKERVLDSSFLDADKSAVRIMRDHVLPQRLVIGAGEMPVVDLFHTYGLLRAWSEKPHLGPKVKMLWSPTLEAMQIKVSVPGNLTEQEASEALLEAFRTNGITVLREPGGAFKAFLTKEAVVTPVDPRPYSLLYTYSLIIALVCGTAGLPHILVRFYTNPDGVAAKRTTMWVMILIGVFYVFPPVFGAFGRNLMPDLYTGLAGIKGTDQVVLKLPVLLNEKYPPLGSILSGITCAGAFAAFMSTFSGLLVSMTGALAHDVYGRILRPKSTPEQRMKMFKIGAVLIGGVAVLLGSFVEPLEINFMVGQAFAIAAASYFPLLFMAVWWRKLTMKGAAVGMLTGGVCALVSAALTNFSNLALDKGPMGKIFAGFAPLNNYWAAHPLLRILCEQPAIWAVPLAITLMVVISKLTAKEVPSDIRLKMLVLHAPEKLGLKQEYIREHQAH